MRQELLKTGFVNSDISKFEKENSTSDEIFLINQYFGIGFQDKNVKIRNGTISFDYGGQQNEKLNLNTLTDTDIYVLGNFIENNWVLSLQNSNLLKKIDNFVALRMMSRVYRIQSLNDNSNIIPTVTGFYNVNGKVYPGFYIYKLFFDARYGKQYGSRSKKVFVEANQLVRVSHQSLPNSNELNLNSAAIELSTINEAKNIIKEANFQYSAKKMGGMKIDESKGVAF